MMAVRVILAIILITSLPGLLLSAEQCQNVEEGKGIGGEIPTDASGLRIQTDRADVLYTIYKGLDVPAQGLVAAGTSQEIDVGDYQGFRFFLLAFGDTTICWGFIVFGTVTWTDPNTKGQLQIEVRITPQADGLWKWEYIVTNLSYNPHGGNGFSSFQIFFADSVNELSGQFGPEGWKMNASVLGPKRPEGASWDKVSGNGAMPGERVTFGFFTAPRESETFFGIAHTWIGDREDFIFKGDLLVPGKRK